MPKPPHNDDYTDISIWGIAALACGAIAILAANLSAMAPETALNRLHLTRLEGGNAFQLRTQIATTQSENARLSLHIRDLSAQLALSQDREQDIMRRLNAMEVSLPLIIESLSFGPSIDYSAVTASIGQNDGAQHVSEDGQVLVRQRVLFDDALPDQVFNQPIPPLPTDMP